jgi:hypothetical protein
MQCKLSFELKSNGTHSEVVNKSQYPIIAQIPCKWMYQYENQKKEKGLQRKLEVLYPKQGICAIIGYCDLLTTSECVPLLLSSNDNLHVTLRTILHQWFKLKEDLNTRGGSRGSITSDHANVWVYIWVLFKSNIPVPLKFMLILLRYSGEAYQNNTLSFATRLGWWATEFYDYTLSISRPMLNLKLYQQLKQTPKHK